MSFIDWNAGAEAGQSALDQQQYAQNQLQQTQQLRALSALRGIDLSNPDSLHQGINALAGLGMFEQAKAASDLSRTAAVNRVAIPLVQQEAAAEGQQGSQSGPGNLDVEKHERLLTEANQALNDIMSTTDPAQRQQKAQSWKAHFASEGVPEDAIDGVIGDLSDPGLQGHQANIQRELQQYTVTNSPGYQGAADALNRFAGKPILTGALAGSGLDPSTGLNLAANITSPARNYQTQAAYAPQIAGSTVAAENIAGANTAGAIQTEAGARTRGVVENTPQSVNVGGVNYEVVPNLSGGTPTLREAQLQPAGSTQTPVPAHGLTPAEVTAQQGLGTAASAQLTADRAASGQLGATMTPLRQIINKLPETNIGPGTPGTNELRSFVISQLPWLAKLDPGYWNEAKIKTADYNTLQKYMVQVATQGLNAAFGAGSDARYAAVVSGNPHMTMDQLGARQVTELAMGAARAQAAPALLFDQTGLPVTDYPSWKAHWGATVDPRGFMLDVLPKADRQRMLAGIAKGSTEAAQLKAAKDAAEQAGFFKDSDIPR